MMDIRMLSRMEKKISRSISPENYGGEKGKGGACPLEEGSAKNAAKDLGVGWKVNPYVIIQPKETFTFADIEGSGIIEHIWMTPTGSWRYAILRMYWDNQENPSVECPMGDFFCMGWGQYDAVNSAAVCVNPGSAFNCYWPMPFRRHAKMTITNLNDTPMTLYYTVNYCLCEVAPEEAYFHAQFRRVNPLPYKQDYIILDGVKGKGKYVGTYMAWGVNNSGWWGEGEIKFFLDGDKEFPTICGTGTEDYFCGSYGFVEPKFGKTYETFSTPYAGMPQVLTPDTLYRSQFRFGLYRWHLPDPIYFENDIRVTIQALGWRGDFRYLPLQDDISSVAYWYQQLPTGTFPPIPDRDYLEIV